MKIYLDNTIFSLQKAGGISIYWAELIKRLAYKNNNIFFESENKNIFRNELDIKTQKESSLNIKFLRYLPFIKRVPSRSIFHSSYYRVSLQKNIINITTVHDFTYEYFRSGIARYIHIWQKNFAIKKSDGIICVSENTKKDLLKFYPMIKESKVKVIYNGVGDEFKKVDNPEEHLTGEFKVLKNKKYILYIGDRSSYKNFDIAVEVLKELSDYSLVIVGGQEFSNSEKEDMQDIENRVYHFRSIDGDKLNTLYNNAFCLLYPSSYEGFGIPISEAMKAGCPVVSTSISSIPEVAGEAALLVDDIKVENFINEIKRIENNEFRNELINKGLKQSKKFSWDKCFEETYSFYKEIHNKKFGE
jgi:glycosyltransferase involved in cell wall biosynthesis